MAYFAAAIVRTNDGWSGRELDLDEVEELDAVADMLRDLLDEEATGPALMLLEENDEYFLIVRVDSVNTADDARTFISDVRATETSELATMLYDASSVELVIDLDESEEDEESPRAEGEPGGDDTLLSDLGTKPDVLRELCVEEGMLPADAIYAICERAGCVDVLEELRGA